MENSLPIKTIRDVFFQTVSIQTGTGFATMDFNQWGNFAKVVLVFLMFVGGCGGSTCGGLKVIRLLCIGKILVLEIEKSFRPQVLRPIVIDKYKLNDNMRIGILSYAAIILITIGVCSCLLLGLEPEIDGNHRFYSCASVGLQRGTWIRAELAPQKRTPGSLILARLYYLYLWLLVGLNFFQ